MIVMGLTLRKQRATEVAFDGAALPTSIRAFHWGWNDFSPRTMTFVSPEQARVVVARMGSRLVSFDWEHQPGASYGYGELRIHEDGMYIDDIRWTPAGAQALANKDEIYISPAYWEDSRRWLHSMVNAALTATPATVFARQLVAASQLGDVIMTPEEFIEWLRKTLAVDPTAALEVLAKAVEDALAAAANAAGPAAGTAAGAPAQQAAPIAAPVTAGIVPGAAGMVMASMLTLAQIDPKDPNAATLLLARFAELSATSGIEGRLAKVEASANSAMLAASGEAKVRAFLGAPPDRQPAGAKLPTIDTSGDKERATRNLEFAKSRGLTPEQMEKYAAKSGYRKVG